MNIRVPFNVSETEIELIIELGKKYHIAVCFNWNGLKENSIIVDKIKQEKIPFFYSSQINNWDELLGCIELGVSDVYIFGDLCFDLENIRHIAQEKKVQIRCFANICYNNWKNGAITDFFIRPEDVDFYGQFIDVIEFYNSEDKQNVLYDVYFHLKEWNGNLQEVIQGLKVNVNNAYFFDEGEFARRRSVCGKKCLKGNKCSLCFRLIELASSLENNPEYEIIKRRFING